MKPDIVLNSPNKSGRNGVAIEAVICHFTAAGDAEGSASWLCNPLAQASAHDLLSRNGKHFRLVPYHEKAWHAGSKSTTPKLNGRAGVNDYSIGIELANWGPIYQPTKDEAINWDTGKKNEKGEPIIERRIRKAGQFYVNLKNWTYPYKGPEPVKHVLETSSVGGFPAKVVEWWEPYDPAQIAKLKLLLTEIIETYGIKRESVARHQDVDPTRKTDTGPALDWKKLLDELYQVPLVSVPDIVVSSEAPIVVASKGGVESVSVEEMLMCVDTSLGDSQPPKKSMFSFLKMGSRS